MGAEVGTGAENQEIMKCKIIRTEIFGLKISQ